MSDPSTDTSAREAALDRALVALPSPQVDRLRARATQLAAARRLAQTSTTRSWNERLEPYVLLALCALQLIWAASRVFAFAR